MIKKGLYRLEANPAAVATIEGELFVGGDMNEVVKKGRDLSMDATAAELAKYHVDKKEDLYAFSQARSEDSAYATGVTTSSFVQSGYSAASGCSSSWYFMGPVGMYSYMPCGGILTSPFGYGFYGLNAGYLWDGPGYYIPPYALLSSYAPVAAVGGAGVTSAAGFKNGTMPVRVPAFSGPNGVTSMPAAAVMSRSALRAMTSGSGFASSARGMPTTSMRSIAGSSMGHVSAVSAARASSAAGGGFAGHSGFASASSGASSPMGSSMASRAGGSSSGGGHR